MTPAFKVGDTVFMGVDADGRPNVVTVAHVHVDRITGFEEYAVASSVSGNIRTRVSPDSLQATEREAWAAEEGYVDNRLSSLRQSLQDASKWKARIRQALRSFDELDEAEMP